MKFSAPIVSSLLATAVSARPHATGEGDPLQQKSRITAFVVDNDGNPSVECWEITNIVDDFQVQRKDGSTATSRAMSLAKAGELDGLDILTWPAASPIWPIPDHDVAQTYFDLAAKPSLFNVQSGLINFNFLNTPFGAADDDDDDEQHVFSLENGDDWFYFEDDYSGSSNAHKANAPPYPFTISTISASETETLRLRYNDRPKHKVLHKGACRFTGISIPDDSKKTSRMHSPLTVQVNMDL
ncbi:hypothetical protein AC579_3524 [Pseudocercospora musae]|uniref:Uncharacterized protein n=1 Tax=Pseudocercospora musae TaxID=113226 RepID=A0A139IVW4_9PEZI|nr:hypothetical protein AC579_3524 [Pseudocercospora musae]